MSFLKSLFTPNVDSAVGSLNKALAELQKAEASHRDASTFHEDQAAMHIALANEQNESVRRAARIRTRLQDLLA